MIQRVLIVRTDRLGDLILTLPMARVLKAYDPSIRVAFMVQNYTAPLLALAPDVDEVVLYDKNWSLARKIQTFRRSAADAIFFPSPRPELAIGAALANTSRRVGTAFRWYSPLFTDKIRDHRKTAELNEADYNVRMLRAIGIEAPVTPLPNLILREADLSLQQQHLTNLFGSVTTRYAVLHLGTGGSAPGWPEEHFIELARWLAHDLGLSIVLTGTATESERIFRVRAMMEQAGATSYVFLDKSLLDLATLLTRADLVVAGSTGPGHLAAALGARTVGLFPLVTALSKRRWGFRGTCVSCIEPSAAPRSECPNCRECVCLEHIETLSVIEALKELRSVMG